MEEKKLKEIEAKLNQLLKESKKSDQPKSAPSRNNYGGVAVIRRRKGYKDLHIA